MMNRNEKLEIAKRLRLSTESELSRDDLEQILDAELSKPEAEMDTELVQQILDLLEETPSQAQQREAWRKTDKRLKLKQWQPVVSGLTKIAAVGVILVALMFATYGTAQALNWEFLLRWMRPFAETFMIYSGDDPEATPKPKTTEVYSDVDLANTQTEFTTLADCPDNVDGCSHMHLLKLEQVITFPVTAPPCLLLAAAVSTLHSKQSVLVCATRSAWRATPSSV